MMYKSPQRRVGSSPHKTIPLKGLFKDGIWHCNCDARLPAARFLTKKEAPNKGKWFYTCQESGEDSCGFFLWDDQAVGREMRAVINNTRSESGTQRKPDASRSAGKAPSSKWIQDLGKPKDDEFGEWSHEDEEAIVEVAQRSIPSSYPETPRKAIKSSPFLTPNSKRKREEIVPTPSSGYKGDDIFGIPSVNKLKGNEMGLRSPSMTPTPSRFRDASVFSDRSENTNSYDITDEVMELLKDQHVDEETNLALRNLLNKHALKISGIAKGRDITRLALKTKDNKIAELQQKINVLETERKMDKAVIRQLKSDVVRSK